MAKRKNHPSRKNSSPKHGSQVNQRPFIQRGRKIYLPLILGFVAAAAIGGYFLLKNEGNISFDKRAVYPDRTLPFPPPKSIKPIEITLADFAGSEACASCHAAEYELWKNSTHGKAGGKPGETKIIAKFDGQPLRFKDAVVTPLARSNGEYVFIVESAGKPPLEIKVEATVGGGFMAGGGTQTFFTRFPDGTVRFLPFDFIRKENLWFVQLRKDNSWVPVSENISLIQDLANWPPHRILGTLEKFSNCQNCHGSQITVRYDQRNQQYETRYTTLRINCESCHGPGKRHIELMASSDAQKPENIHMEPLAALSKDQSLMVCFQCHAVKDPLQGDYLPGKPLEDYFSLKFPILGSEPYLPDGRVRSFAYQQNHLYSDCYLNGSMTCVDCHEPHSQEYRDVFGKPLIGKFDNRQCTGCHASKAKAPENHSHHQPDSPGNLCTSCHMPFLQHQSIGNKLAFTRSDHTIPIPRLAFDQQIGIENACIKCHQDKNTDWLEMKLSEWYGKIKPHKKFISNLIEAENIADQTTAAKLLLNPAGYHPIAQMTGLVYFIKRHLRPNMHFLDREIVDKLKAFAVGDDLDLKALALMALHLSYDHKSEVRGYLVGKISALGEKENAVRNRWGIAADYFGSLYASKGDFKNAIISYQKSLEVKPDDIFTITNLANAYRGAGDYPNSISTMKEALQLQPQQASLYFQIAQLHVKMQQVPRAIDALKEGLKYDPGNQNAKRMLQQLRAR